MLEKIINNLQSYQSDCVDAFIMECSSYDIETDPEARKLAKYINRQGKIIDKVAHLLTKFTR